MDATYQTLAAAAELGEFTVALVASRAAVKETTVRTVLSRHRHLFDQRTAGSGRRGGQPQVWKVKEGARAELDVIIASIAKRFDEDQRSILSAGAGGQADRASVAGRLRMSPGSPELATAEDLEAFAPHLTARELLPHMVRRLLTATPGVTSVAVRAGDGIGLAGLDGRADTTVGSAFVPAGQSVWELGTSNNPRAKAQDDFRRRSNNPLDVDPATTTFVAVSMGRFDGKEDWASRARNKGRWRDVRVLDADDLFAWLEETPQVHVWVSEQLGLRPSDVMSLSRWWESWLSETNPPTPGELILAGRHRQARELRSALHSDGQVVGIYATSREEAMAFAAAALLLEDSDGGYAPDVDPLSTTTTVVLSRRAWDRLAGSSPRSVYLPRFEDPDVAGAIRQGHCVVVPMGANDDQSRARIHLPPMDRELARDVLRRAMPSVDLPDADRLASHARRNIVSFRRSLAVDPAYKVPAWARRPSADVLAPLVLLVSWEAESTDDQAVVAEIVGSAYQEIERDLRRPADPEDPPFIRAGNRWQLTSPIDAWSNLHPVLASGDLERWRAVAARVLTEEDPTLDLEEHDRFLAGARGVRREHSSALRSGLARGAALLASDPGTAPDGARWSDHAAMLVEDLLGGAVNPRRWAELADVLPILAEASPETLLRSAAAGLAGDDPPLKSLFADSRKDVWESRSPHTGLLWALELLCWCQDYVAEACDVLARLAEVDPGGRLANRPAASLRRVLLPWYPRTPAPLDVRTDIVRGILERHPCVGWQLLLGLMPHHFDSSEPSYRPLFRDWKSQGIEATLAERIDATGRLVDTALAQLKISPRGWPEFLELLPQLVPADLSRCLSALGQVDLEGIDTDLRMATWQALTKLISAHRQFPTAEWALPDSLLKQFEEIATAWEPLQSPERHARLFSWHPDLPGTDKFDHEAYDTKLSETRQRVVAGILATDSEAGLTRLIREAPVPGFVGVAIAEVQGAKALDNMLAFLDQPGPERQAAVGWIVRITDIAGREWTTSILERASRLPEGSRTQLYLALPNEPETWNSVDREPRTVADQFWQSIGTLTARPEHALQLVERLLEHRRAWSAVDLLAHHSHRPDYVIPADLIERTLRAAAAPDIDEAHPPGALDYDLGVLLDRLEASGVPDDTLVELEWMFFAPLQHTRPPRALFKALAAQPALFVDLVCAVFKPASEPVAEEGGPVEAARAQQALRVLREWRQPPGLLDSDMLDAQALRDWVTTARQLLADADRTSIGDECIGEVLSGSPPGADGIWPAEAIRQLLQEIDSQSIAQGLAIGKFNARGFTTRGVFDGGQQEDALADQYEAWSRQVMARWPQTGRLLREMARSYRSWARRQDAMSEEWASGD